MFAPGDARPRAEALMEAIAAATPHGSFGVWIEKALLPFKGR
jgi:hypothetical protein